MTDFTIIGTVFLHGRAWKRGNEAALQEAGFTDEQKQQQAARRMIRWKPKKTRTKKTA